MNILSIVHDSTAPTGLLAEGILRRGGVFEEVMPGHGDPLPNGPQDHDGLIILGGCMDADDDAGYPHYAPLLDLARAFHAEGKPVMGVCLGAQLLARAFGGGLARMAAVEVGFTETAMTAAGAADPLLRGLAPRQRLMQWHQDMVHLPAGATLLMSNDRCANQAFRLGTTTYGFQFHLEATRTIVRTWLKVNEDFLRANEPGYFAEAERQLALHAPGQARFTATVTDRWLDLVAARTATESPRLRAASG